jgi:hypothetical protein
VCATLQSLGFTISLFAAALSASAASGIIISSPHGALRAITSKIRAAFIACKRSGVCTAHVWAFAANLEWRLNRCPEVARQLFDVGMKQFSNDIDFVLEYAGLFSGSCNGLFSCRVGTLSF